MWLLGDNESIIEAINGLQSVLVRKLREQHFHPDTCSELHHIHYRRHGGATSLDNAAWLCAYHHWLVHEGGWTLHRRTPATSNYLWTSPHGTPLTRHTETA